MAWQCTPPDPALWGDVGDTGFQVADLAEPPAADRAVTVSGISTRCRLIARPAQSYAAYSSAGMAALQYQQYVGRIPRERPHSGRALSLQRVADDAEVRQHRGPQPLGERALARTAPAGSTPGRFTAPDNLLAFLRTL